MTTTFSDGEILGAAKLNGALSERSLASDLANATDLAKGAALVGRVARDIADVATLRTLVGNGRDTVSLLGYYTPGDGGGGQFYWDSMSIAADNGGTIILPTGYAGNGRWMRNTSVFNVLGFGAKGDWDGTTGTIDSAAFQALTAAVVAAGGGHIVIPPRNYRITPAIGGVLCAFSNVAVSIDATGATFTDTTTYVAGDFATLFEFTACSVRITGKPKVVTQKQDIGYGTDLGLSAFVFKQGCAPVDIDIEVDGGIYGVKFNRLSTDPLSYKSRNIKARVKANRVHYPYAAQFSGDSAQVDLDVTDCGRNFFLYGISDVHVRVRSVNQKVTSLIKSYAGLGCDEVTVDYYDRDSTSCNSAAPLLGLEWGDSTAATHRNIHITLNCSNPAGAPRGNTISLDKYSDGGGTADTTGRGHILDGFMLTGVNDNSTVAVNHVTLGSGAFASTDVFRNIAIKDFLGMGSSSNLYMPLQVLNDVSHWSNVVLRSGNIFTNNGAAGKVVFTGCTAANFTSATTSVDVHDYISCNIYDASSQNTANNKNLINSIIKDKAVASYARSGQYYQAASALKTGDLTVASNVFKIPASIYGLMLRLHYHLIYDQAVTDPATRREVFGVKSFSVTINSTGAVAVQMPVADSIAERTLGTTPAVISVSLVNGDASGAFIAISATNYNVAGSRADLFLEAISLSPNISVSAA